MADVFISYAPTDRPLASKLAAMLEAEGWKVSWDRPFVIGEFRPLQPLQWAQTERSNARAVIAIWTDTSIKSSFVTLDAFLHASKSIHVKLPHLTYKDIPDLAYKKTSKPAVNIGEDELIRAALVELLGQPPERRHQAPEPVPKNKRRRQEADRWLVEESSRKEPLTAAGTQSRWTFISFTNQDWKAATEILNELEGASVRCWLANRDVPYGRDYQEAIADALDQADSMVLVFSNDANNSEDVAREVALASARKILILPVRIEDARPAKALRYQLANRQYIDLYDDREAKMKSIVETLYKVRHRPS